MLLRACGLYERAPSFLRQYGGQVMGCLKASGSLMGAIVEVVWAWDGASCAAISGKWRLYNLYGG